MTSLLKRWNGLSFPKKVEGFDQPPKKVERLDHTPKKVERFN